MAEASNNQKDTVYIDVDDEITAIIDKVRGSKHKIVALVLPKRATVLQSIVNMKLLKRASDESRKRIVLITSEAGLLPLAGAVKLYVAKTLQTKPEIPDPPKVPSADVALDEAGELDDEPEVDDGQAIDKSKPVGELATSKAKNARPGPEDTIELDDDELDEAGADKPDDKASKKSDKKLKIPNFNKFRTRILLIGGGLVLLIVFWILAIFVLPKASIVVKTDNETSNVDLTFTANTATKSLDESAKKVPAVSKQTKNTDSVKVTATGKKNVGDKATGTVTLRLTDCSQSQVTIPAGTGVSSNGLTFLTQEEITLSSVKIGSSCKNSDFPTFSTGTTKVIAQDSGDQFNLSERDYSVAAVSSVTARGNAMTGGTTKNVTVVSDQDIANAKQQLTDKSKNTAQTDLTKQFRDGNLFPLPDTLTSANGQVTSTPNVGEEASDVTVNSEVTYSMLGIKKDDLKKLVVNDAKKDIDTSKQAINDDGIDKAVFRVVDKKSDNEQSLSVQSTVSTGVSVDENELKQQIAGKKRGDVQNQLGSLPGVKDVQVKYSPFWVSVTPKKASRITITFEKL